MPELFGVCSTDGLTPDHLAGFKQICDELVALRPGRVDTEARSWVAVGVLSRHDHDNAVIVRPDPPRPLSAWVGTIPSAESSVLPANLPGLLTQGQHDRLWTCEPRFAAFAADDGSRSAWLISDRHGLYPLYYACDNGVLVFGTSCTTILRCGLVDWKLDPAGVVDLFTFEHVTGDRTLSDRVLVLPPATALRFSSGTITLHSYRREIVTSRIRGWSTKEAAKCLYCELSNSVARSVAGATSVAVTLSGGMDSRALLHCAVSQRANVAAFTFGRPASRDIIYAEQLARLCGVPHTVVEVDGSFLQKWLEYAIHITGGMIGCVHFHILSLAGAIAEDAACVLDGLGGDALTGAHLKWRMVHARSADRAVGIVYRQRATAWRAESDLRQVLHPDFLRESNYDPKEAVRKHFRNLDYSQLWIGCHRFDLVERQRRFIQYGPGILQPIVGVETPFYANGVVECVSRFSTRQLLEQRAYLSLHSEHMRELAKVPDSLRGVPLTYPSSFRFAKKVFDFAHRRVATRIRCLSRSRNDGTTDYPSWLRTGLFEFARERILDDGPVYAGILQREELERLLRDHRDGTTDNSSKLGCLLAFVTWRRMVAK